MIRLSPMQTLKTDLDRKHRQDIVRAIESHRPKKIGEVAVEGWEDWSSWYIPRTLGERARKQLVDWIIKEFSNHADCGSKFLKAGFVNG